MEPRVTIIGVWHLRLETLGESVERLNTTFRRLGELTPLWTNWFRSYKSVADRKRGPVFLSDRPDLIRQEMILSQQEHEVDPVMGYSIWAAAGDPKGKGTEASFLRVHCCIASPYTINEIRLQLPVRSAKPVLYDAELLARAVVILTQLWDPEWLTAPQDLLGLVPRPWEGGPVLGWVNYLPDRTGIVEEPLPLGWRWFDGRGDKQIFIHEDGPPDSNNPEHIAACERMAARIRWGNPPKQPDPVQDPTAQ